MVAETRPQEASGTATSARSGVRVGLLWAPVAPLTNVARAVRLARLMRLDFMVFRDHVQGFLPRSIWDRRLGFWVAPGSSPHEMLEVFTTAGRLTQVAG